MTWGGFVILIMGAASIGLLCMALSAPSTHTFQPRPDKPGECRLCGRREIAHQPKLGA